MYRPHQHANGHAWMCTAYHEAGHAIAALLLGRDVYRVEVTGCWEGFVWHEGRYGRIVELTELANQERRVRSDLLRLWLDDFWIADAGVIAEEEFNLVPLDVLARGGHGDVMKKLVLISCLNEGDFISAYYDRQVGPWLSSVTAACRIFIRTPHVARLTRTLAEVLLRTRQLDGAEVIDVLLSSRAAIDRQRDLFWAPVREDLWGRQKTAHIPKQYSLL